VNRRLLFTGPNTVHKRSGAGAPRCSTLPTRPGNLRTEGFNRIIKQTKRVGCGYRSMANHQRRISHIAVTRPHGSAA
jgi:hypothetical protein